MPLSLNEFGQIATISQGTLTRMMMEKIVEVTLLDRLLDIIAEEGLVERIKLQPMATLDQVNLTPDDLILIANKIEREFDRDLLHDEELERLQTVGELLDLIVARIRN